MSLRGETGVSEGVRSDKRALPGVSRSKNLPLHEYGPRHNVLGVSKTLTCVRPSKGFAQGFAEFAPRKRKPYRCLWNFPSSVQAAVFFGKCLMTRERE